MTEPTRYLLDVNTLVALLNEDHLHHDASLQWFSTPGLQWSICAITEAGLLRYMTRPNLGQIGMVEATAMLAHLSQQPGYHYQPILADWHTLSRPFSQRLFGHKQVTDACLLGMAIREGLVLTTFDEAILYLAGEHSHHVLLLNA